MRNRNHDRGGSGENSTGKKTWKQKRAERKKLKMERQKRQRELDGTAEEGDEISPAKKCRLSDGAADEDNIGSIIKGSLSSTSQLMHSCQGNTGNLSSVRTSFCT